MEAKIQNLINYEKAKIERLFHNMQISNSIVFHSYDYHETPTILIFDIIVTARDLLFLEDVTEFSQKTTYDFSYFNAKGHIVFSKVFIKNDLK